MAILVNPLHGRQLRTWLFLAIALIFNDSRTIAQTPQEDAARYLEQLWRTSGVPSITVAVARQQQIVFSGAVGYADLDNLVPATASTVYNIGSISKVMATVAVMQLIGEGRVHLDDPIQQYVPDFPEKGAPITLWHLLTHTSGIRHYRPFDFPHGLEDDNVATYATLGEAISLFKDDSLLFRPGAFYSYTSYGVNLLQGVVETASGLGFEDYMQTRVWGPAGMSSSSFDLPERIVRHRARGYKLVDGQVRNYYPNENVTYKFAGGGMLSTAEDLVRFGNALLGDVLLRKELTDSMFTPQFSGILHFDEGGGAPQPLRWRQALMWRIRDDEKGRPYVHHSGTVKGFNACLILYREEGLVVAVIENGSGAATGLKEARTFADFFHEPAAKPGR